MISALLIIMLSTQISVKAEDISQTSKPYGGTLRWGTRNTPTTINPILTTGSVSAALVQLMFNGLVRLNSKGEIVPDLAESWEISGDGLVYTFYLRKGVRFHDGRECIADDVEFTYNKIMDADVDSPFRPHFQLVERFNVIDRYTFQVTLRKPSSAFLYRMVRYIMPKHILEREDLKKTDFNLHPIGTGPFRFKEWSKAHRIILEYNPDYYQGRPYLNKIVVKTYAHSEDVWSALMRAEVDYAAFMERKDYEVVRDDPAFQTYAIPADYYYALLYNLDDPVLADKRVRYALAYGINTKALIKRIAYGYGRECSGPFYPELLGFNPYVLPFEYNPKKALELLEEAGWKDADNDGILEKESEELEIKVLIESGRDIFERMIMLIRQQLQEIGIKTKVILRNREEIFKKGFLEQTKAQAHLRLFLGGVSPEQTIDEWYSKISKRRCKLWIYRNEEVDRLFELGRVISDNRKREEIYQGIHRLIYEDQPACFLYFPFDFHAVSAKFADVDEFFTVNMPRYTMKDWYIKKGRGVKKNGDY